MINNFGWIGNYEIDVGKKYKNKNICSIEIEELVGYLEWISSLDDISYKMLEIKNILLIYLSSGIMDLKNTFKLKSEEDLDNEYAEEEDLDILW